MKLGTTSAQKKLFFNLRKAKAKVGALEEGDLRPENVAQIAKDLNVTEDEVIDMNRRLSGGDASLNATVGRTATVRTQWQDWLEDEDSDQAGAYAERDELDARRELLVQAMAVLNDREKDILMQRRLSDDPVTLEELSESYGVSRERIRQIEVRAFEKLQARMRELARGKGMADPGLTDPRGRGRFALGPAPRLALASAPIQGRERHGPGHTMGHSGGIELCPEPYGPRHPSGGGCRACGDCHLEPVQGRTVSRLSIRRCG